MIYSDWTQAEELAFENVIRFVKESSMHYCRVSIETGDLRAGQLRFHAQNSEVTGQFVVKRLDDQSDKLVLYFRYDKKRFYLFGSSTWWSGDLFNYSWDQASEGLSQAALKVLLSHMKYTAKVVNILVNSERMNVLRRVTERFTNCTHELDKNGFCLADYAVDIDSAIHDAVDMTAIDSESVYRNFHDGSWVEWEK